MSQPKLDQFTLREKCRDATVFTRELMEHLELSVSPKVHKAFRTIEKGIHEQSLSDALVRELANEVLECENFTAKLTQKCDAYLEAINEEVRQIVEG